MRNPATSLHSSLTYYPVQPESGSSQIVPLLAAVNQPPSVARVLAEFFVYVPIVVASFVSQLGLVQIKFAGGGVQLACGLIVLGLVLGSGTGFSLSIWCALLMNICATVSQVVGQGELPLVGGGLPGMAFWFFNLLGTCYIVQNLTAERRMLLFYVIFMTVLTLVGGTYMKTHKVLRLNVEGLGGGFSNPNGIAFKCGIFAIVLLFWSLRSKIAIRPMIWFMALFMGVQVMRTVSRVGMVLFAVGFVFFLLTIVGGKGMRGSGVIFLAVLIIAISQFAYFIADHLAFFQKRMELRSAEGRLGIYQFQTLIDLGQTMFIGKGPGEAQLTSTGIQAHNTFVYVHMSWGGLTAYIYLAWMTILAIRIYRAVVSKELPIDIRMQLVALYLMVLGGDFTTNVGFYDYAATFAIAILEKYTVPFSRKQIAARHAYVDQTPLWHR